ncbi:MAG TPA: response regulator transcription factor [Edaphocola sp.]|nr:response regulator transcription factor [Edaphocola sp.]
MPEIKCLIIDDEPLARKLVSGHVNRLPGWTIVGSCKNALEAYEMLMSQKIDVIFLDINMPVVSGTDFYRSLKDPPLLVFTTAYPDYAVEGFELDAVDYLVKPITFDRLLKAADRVQARLQHQESGGVAQSKTEPSAGTIKPGFIFIKHFSKLVKVKFEDLLYLEAQKDFVRFVTKNEEILAGMTMKQAEEQLPESLFLRVHRSYIVSISAITAMFGNTIELGKIQLPIGANFKEKVMERLK